MTHTRTRDRQATPIGQAIGQAVGQAESALTRLLAGVLAETGTTRQTYLAMQRLSAHGDHTDLEAYVHDLSDSLDLDLWVARELTNGLVAEGLVTLTDKTVSLAPAGAQRRARIRDSIAAVMAPTWAAIDPADLETTVRTLRELTARARETLAARADGAGAAARR